MQLKKEKNFRSMLQITVLLLVSAVLIYSLYYTVQMIKYSAASQQKEIRDYTYHIALVGEPANSEIIGEIYKGASSLSSTYNVMVDNLVPKAGAGTASIQPLIEYATAMSVDGIIAYVPDKNVKIFPAITTDGNHIPMLMIGNDNPEAQGIAYIGINGYELGKEMAETLASSVTGGKILAVYDSTGTAELYGRILSSFREVLLSQGTYTIENTDVRRKAGISAEDLIHDAIRSQADIKAVVCLSTDNTIRVAETILDLNMAGKISVIGFGDTQKIQEYLDKGVLSASISQQPEDMGSQAVQTLVEYITAGNTNEYTTVPVRVIRSTNHDKP